MNRTEILAAAISKARDGRGFTPTRAIDFRHSPPKIFLKQQLLFSISPSVFCIGRLQAWRRVNAPARVVADDSPTVAHHAEQYLTYPMGSCTLRERARRPAEVAAHFKLQPGTETTLATDQVNCPTVGPHALDSYASLS